jgi:glc operon protein GlcG
VTITTPARALIAALFLAIPAGATPLMSQTRTTHVLTLEAARKAAAAGEAEARRQGWEMSIAVVDPSGTLLHFIRMDGAPASSVDLSLGKARTSARFRRPSKALADGVAEGRVGLVGAEGMLMMEGAVPVVVNGEVVAAIGVSGATGAQDAQVAAAGAATVQ